MASKESEEEQPGGSTTQPSTPIEDPIVNGDEVEVEINLEVTCCHVSDATACSAITTDTISYATTSSFSIAAIEAAALPPPDQAKPAGCQLLERLNFPEGNIINTLHTILALPPFDPYAPPPKSETVYKEVVSLMQWSLRDDNAIELELSDKLLHACDQKSTDPNDKTRSYLVSRQGLQGF